MSFVTTRPEMLATVPSMSNAWSGHDPTDDPIRRRPSIARAQERVTRRPEIQIEEGLQRTAKWFGSRPRQVAAAADPVAGSQEQGSSSVDLRDVVVDRGEVRGRRATARSAGGTSHLAHLATTTP
jgi:hypothetical protein